MIDVAGVVLPVVTPVTIPVVPDEIIVATDVVPLVHEPPGVMSVNMVVLPWHTLSVPEIGAVAALTVKTAVLVQPKVDVYVMTAVPAETPATAPLIDPKLTLELVVDHVPPPGVPVSVVVPPMQVLSVPVIDGDAFTVTVVVAAQPVDGRV